MSFITRLFKPRLFTAEASAKHSLLTWDEGCVQAGVVRFNNGSAELLGVANLLVNGLARSGNPDMDRWSYGCEQSLHLAEDMTHLNGGSRVIPQHLAIGLPSSLVHSLPIVVSRNRRGQNEAIGRMEVQALLDRGYRQARDTLELQDCRLQIVHGSIGQFTLGGQPVREPSGLHGSELEAHLCFHLIPIEWLRATQRLTQQLLIQVSLLLPEAVALAAHLNDDMSWLIILDSHCSTIALVNHGALMWSAKIAVGEREMVSEIGKIMAMQGREMDVLMRTYREGRLTEEAENRLARAFWFQLTRWMSALAQEAESALVSIRSIPQHIYWLDRTNSMPEARQALLTPTWAESLPFDAPPEISELNAQDLRGVLDCTAQANSSAFLTIRAMAVAAARALSTENVWERHLLQIIRGRRG